MRLRLFKPLDGWRAFWGKVGIIVLSILIAPLCAPWPSRTQ